MRGSAFLVVAGAAVLAVVAGVALLRTPGDRSQPTGAASPGDLPAAERFVADYVDDDGRVVRHDQGDDTVSEGQAYALMLALALDDEDLFSRVWSWTADNLQRSDDLFAWHWAGGEVVDDNPAADADLDIASALFIGASQFDHPRWSAMAARVADAVMEHETFTAGDRRILAAAPWAVEDRIVNPSYLARCGYEDLAGWTDDARWSSLGHDSLNLLRSLVDEGLPPDWAVVDEDGTARPIPSPDQPDAAGAGAGRYGPDAARIPMRLAACPAGADIAADLWDRLRDLPDGGQGLAYGLDGSTLDATAHPIGLVGAAGAALAAGDRSEADDRMAEAEALDQQAPTYYGGAWLALAETVMAARGEDVEQPVLELVAARGPVGASGPLAGGQTQPTTTTSTPASTGTTATTVAPTTTAGETTSTSESSGTTTTEGGSTTSTTGTDSSQPGSPTTAPGGPGQQDAGDLSAPEADNPLVSGSERDQPDEPARRRTGLIVAGGLGATAALGALLGLRERTVLLRRSRQPG